MDEWTEKADALSLQAKEALTQALRDAGYDGVFLHNDAGSWGRSTDAYIALDPEQVKNTDNAEPTTNPDIRLSIKGSESAAARRSMTAEERRLALPALGDENTVFAESGANDNYFFMSKEETKSIREQLQKHQDRLNTMEVVGSVNTMEYAGLSTREAREKLTREMKKTGYKVDRQNFGEIRFEESEINESLNYKEKQQEAEDARRTGLLLLQKVLKRGIEIEGHDKHKGRNYNTVTIAAPVEINGERGNMAVVVKRTKGNRYKVHRILTPAGDIFTLPKMANAEKNTAGAVTNNGHSLGGSAPTINSASDRSVPQAGENSNNNFSLKGSNALAEYIRRQQAGSLEEAYRQSLANYDAAAGRLTKANLQSLYEAAIAQARASGDSNLASALYQELLRVLGLRRDDEHS